MSAFCFHLLILSEYETYYLPITNKNCTNKSGCLLQFYYAYLRLILMNALAYIMYFTSFFYSGIVVKKILIDLHQ